MRRRNKGIIVSSLRKLGLRLRVRHSSLNQQSCGPRVLSKEKNVGQMLLIYDDPSDHRSQSLDDASSTEESPNGTTLSLEAVNDVIPYIRPRFLTHDAAYEFYNTFAKRCGFQYVVTGQKAKTELAKDLPGAILFAIVLVTHLSKLKVKENHRETEDLLDADVKHS